MAIVRSPGYPSQSLKDAVELTGQLYDRVRRNPLDRESAVKELGYSGLTGASQKMLSNLAHFGLIEKAGKGDVRVSDLAVKVLHPKNDSERREAILSAAFNPELFALIRDNYPDGHVTEMVLRSFLKRNEFSEAAISPAVRSFLDTYAYAQEEAGIESYSHLPIEVIESADPPNDVVPNTGYQAVPSSSSAGVPVMAGERVVFVDEAGPSAYLKLVASGDLDDDMLEALEDFIKRMRKRLAKAVARADKPHGGERDRPEPLY